MQEAFPGQRGPPKTRCDSCRSSSAHMAADEPRHPPQIPEAFFHPSAGCSRAYLLCSLNMTGWLGTSHGGCCWLRIPARLAHDADTKKTQKPHLCNSVNSDHFSFLSSFLLRVRIAVSHYHPCYFCNHFSNKIISPI